MISSEPKIGPEKAFVDQMRPQPFLQAIRAGMPVQPPTFYTRRGKRIFDVVMASLLLVVLGLPMLVIAAIVRMTSPGNSFFVQDRVGQHTSTFRCYKFRTMVEGADIILLENPQMRDAMSVSWKIPDDPRVTRIGQLMRPHSLDEFPQLLNVVKGEMSLVGPRPYLPHELHDTFGAHAFTITQVKPGMTGLWQVSGRSHLSPMERIQLDEQYVACVNFKSDLRLLTMTVRVVFNRHGAF